MSLAEIRAKLLAQENRGQPQQQKYTGDKASYPLWDMPEGSQTILRLLPDADKSNSFFWVERNMIMLPFNGVVGGSDSKQYTVQVPCVEMYGDNCPILAEVRTWYKDDSLKDLANKYWKKRTYLFQGFVRQGGFTEEDAPENPIRRFVIRPQLFSIIKDGLKDTQIEEIPTDYERGLDFIIKKGHKGDYADYSNSNYARRESALTDAEQDAIAQYGLYDLKEFLPKKPSESELRVIKEMFEASVDGRPYDTKWAAYYKPWGLNIEGAGATHGDDGVSSPVTRQAPTAPTPTISTMNEEPTEVSDVKVTAPSGNANDILALIRSRQNKTA